MWNDEQMQLLRIRHARPDSLKEFPTWRTDAALVPHSSPISQTGLLFNNILLDENASNHIALGRAFKFNIEGGERMSDDEFCAAGGNSSLTHFDFMIGSGEMDVAGITESGVSETLMSKGEWAFQI